VLVGLCACGRVGDLGATHDGGAAFDVMDAGRDSTVPTEASVDAGCDSGVVGITCIATAGLEYVTAALAVDDSNIYWAKSGQIDGVLLKIGRDGGTTTTLASTPLLREIVSDGTTVFGMSNGDVIAGGLPTIISVPVAGGAVTKLATVADGAVSCIAVDESSVYWTLSSVPSAVVKIPKGGGTIATLVSNPQGLVRGTIAVDDASVYWAAGGVNKLSKDGGGTVTTLVAGVNAGVGPCQGFAIMGSSAFVVDSDGGAYDILSVSIDGGDASVIVDSGSPFAVLAGSAGIVWASGPGPIYVTPLGGGAARVITTPLSTTLPLIALARDGTLYMATDRQLQSIRIQ